MFFLTQPKFSRRLFTPAPSLLHKSNFAVNLGAARIARAFFGLHLRPYFTVTV